MASHLKVSLDASAQSYPIYVQAGLLAHCGEVVRQQFPIAKTVAIITDDALPPHYLQQVQASLGANGFTVHVAAIPAREEAKTLETLTTLYTHAVQWNLKRNDIALALGGGIIGDITGFFAATYMRGMRFIQVPTTLLGQVDASVGGKVAVNFSHLKNLIGAFYQPDAVLIDPDTLKTLPDRELLCGLAEVVKYAFLQASIPHLTPPSPLLAYLEDTPLEAFDWSFVITECCRLKAAVVAADPQEQHGIRDMLNLGHTFAHAYETVSNNTLAHGEAVSIGMHHALDLSFALNLISAPEVYQAKTLLARFNLPSRAPQLLDPAALLEAMGHDKKNRSQSGDEPSIRFILPVSPLGAVHIQSIANLDCITAIVAFK